MVAGPDGQHERLSVDLTTLRSDDREKDLEGSEVDIVVIPEGAIVGAFDDHVHDPAVGGSAGAGSCFLDPPFQSWMTLHALGTTEETRTGRCRRVFRNTERWSGVAVGVRGGVPVEEAETYQELDRVQSHETDLGSVALAGQLEGIEIRICDHVLVREFGLDPGGSVRALLPKIPILSRDRTPYPVETVQKHFLHGGGRIRGNAGFR